MLLLLRKTTSHLFGTCIGALSGIFAGFIPGYYYGHKFFLRKSSPALSFRAGRIISFGFFYLLSLPFFIFWHICRGAIFGLWKGLRASIIYPFTLKQEFEKEKFKEYIAQYQQESLFVHTYQTRSIQLTLRLQQIDTREDTQLIADIENFLHELERTVQENNDSVLKDPHINYFLGQVSRYNGLFLSVQRAEDIHTQPSDARIGIRSPLLGNGAHTKLSYTSKVGEAAQSSFTPPFCAIQDGKMRYFYDESQAPHFIRDYRTANAKIGLATQLSNIQSHIPRLGEKHVYMQGRDKSAHERERKLFNSAQDALEKGLPLTSAQLAVLQHGQFYRSTGAAFPFGAFSHNNLALFHVGHASTLLHIGGITIGVDLINYETARVLYPRETEAGIRTNHYPLLHVLFFTHNHYDHMDKRTIQELIRFKNALVIVPAGDAQLLRLWGFTNIVEFASGNDSVDLTTPAGKQITIHALPARHASNRGITDFNTSFYMGIMAYEKDQDHLALLTGDTAIWSAVHHDQLEAYCQQQNRRISVACIAAGPDRPREYMECTHQSSADALTFHARLTAINTRLCMQRRQNLSAENNVDDFAQGKCIGIAYHQGCYRLGTLSYHDVDATFTRTMAVLNSCGDLTLDKVLEHLHHEKALLDKLSSQEEDTSQLTNYYFYLMDEFERVALLETLQVYQQLCSPHLVLTARHILSYLEEAIIVPVPGLHTNFNDVVKGNFPYDFMKLIVNRDPTRQQICAYESILQMLAQEGDEELQNVLRDPTVPLGDEAKIVRKILNVYHKKEKNEAIAACIQQLETHHAQSTPSLLIQLRGKIKGFATCDNSHRTEDTFETLLLVIMGLIDEAHFRIQLARDYSALVRKTTPETKFAGGDFFAGKAFRDEVHVVHEEHVGSQCCPFS